MIRPLIFELEDPVDDRDRQEHQERRGDQEERLVGMNMNVTVGQSEMSGFLSSRARPQAP